MAQLPGAAPSVPRAEGAAEGRPGGCSAVMARAVRASIAGRSLPLLLPRKERAGKPLLGLGAPYRMEATASSRKLWCSLQTGLVFAFAGTRLESSGSAVVGTWKRAWDGSRCLQLGHYRKTMNGYSGRPLRPQVAVTRLGRLCYLCVQRIYTSISRPDVLNADGYCFTWWRGSRPPPTSARHHAQPLCGRPTPPAAGVVQAPTHLQPCKHAFPSASFLTNNTASTSRADETMPKAIRVADR